MPESGRRRLVWAWGPRRAGLWSRRSGIIVTPMATNLSVTFTGLRFENPFLLASAPPTESESNITRAFDAGWGGVVTKTIGLHPRFHADGPTTHVLWATPATAATAA